MPPGVTAPTPGGQAHGHWVGLCRRPSSGRARPHSQPVTRLPETLHKAPHWAPSTRVLHLQTRLPPPLLLLTEGLHAHCRQSCPPPHVCQRDVPGHGRDKSSPSPRRDRLSAQRADVCPTLRSRTLTQTPCTCSPFSARPTGPGPGTHSAAPSSREVGAKHACARRCVCVGWGGDTEGPRPPGDSLT